MKREDGVVFRIPALFVAVIGSIAVTGLVIAM